MFEIFDYFPRREEEEKLTSEPVLELQGGILWLGHDLYGDFCDREHLQAA